FTQGSTSGAYAYNGDGLRTSKTINGTATNFTWDVADGLPLVLTDGSNAYVYGPDGRPLEQINGSSAVFFHQDQLGSTRALTDATGTVVATYSYDNYGNTTGTTGTATTPLQFAGQYHDNESGLYYLRARYYDPTTAQFLSKDPLAALTRDPYTYTDGNPLNLTDPTGLYPGQSIV